MSKASKDKNEAVPTSNNNYPLHLNQFKKTRDPSNALDYKSFYKMALEDPDMKKYQVNDWFGLKLGTAFAYKYGLKLILFTIRHFYRIIWKYKK